MAYNFEIRSERIKLLIKYENVTQHVLFSNTFLSELIYVRKYDVITLNGESSRESNVRALVLRKYIRQ
jgi:hypothetical protein